MKNDPLKRLWQLKRDVPAPAPCEDEGLPPGLATRIASRWAAHSPSALGLWERVTAGTLVLCLIICGAARWLQPKADPTPDVMLSLFTARAAPDDGFPF